MERHVLASANMLLGASNFLVLALPERYRVGQTINPNEVNGTAQARGAAWVQDGRCSHYLRDGGTVRALEFLLVARRGVVPPGWAADPSRAIRVADHEGSARADTMRVGFPRRRDLDRLRLWWPCERTGRSLELELLGPLGAAPDDLIAALERSECH